MPSFATWHEEEGEEKQFQKKLTPPAIEAIIPCTHTDSRISASSVETDNVRGKRANTMHFELPFKSPANNTAVTNQV